MKDVKEQKQNDNGEIIEMKQGQVIKIPKNSGKAWLTLFYSLPQEFVSKRPVYLNFPRWLCGWNSIQIKQNRREPERRKKQMKLTKYEQETIINFNNDEQEASIYTASPQMMRKLDALAAAYPEHYQVVEQTEVSKTYSCEKHLINLRKPRKVNEEHSQWARQRMQEMNRHKNAGNL